MGTENQGARRKSSEFHAWASLLWGDVPGRRGIYEVLEAFTESWSHLQVRQHEIVFESQKPDSFLLKETGLPTALSTMDSGRAWANLGGREDCI